MADKRQGRKLDRIDFVIRGCLIVSMLFGCFIAWLMTKSDLLKYYFRDNGIDSATVNGYIILFFILFAVYTAFRKVD